MDHFHAPETLMMSHGYDAHASSGAVKQPLFLTSTFVFKTAEEGKTFFEHAYGIREKGPQEHTGWIYSRISNPNLEILESRLCLWDKAEDCAVFGSGMAAISTILMAFLKPGDLLLHSLPVYGGTDHLINSVMREMGVDAIGFYPHQTKEEIIEMLDDAGAASRLKHIFIETPTNPTNQLIDIRMCRDIADHFSTPRKKIKLSVDNTFMGPVWCHPLQNGADIIAYSATKFIGGHSDIIAGAVLGDRESMAEVKKLRAFLGNTAPPHTCWLLSRSLETLQIRMQRQAENAVEVARFLDAQDLVKRVVFLGNLDKSSRGFQVFEEQYSSPGSMISFYLNGGEAEAFNFLNRLRLIKMAVSLGGTESLAQHPSSMTHAGVCSEMKTKLGISDNLIRLSVGIENRYDLIEDIRQAFA